MKINIITLVFLLSDCLVTCQTGNEEFPILKGPYLGQEPPGSSPKIFAPGIVSTDYFNHSTISIAPDGSEIFWSMAPLDKPDRIYSSKIINGVWTKPEIISFTLAENGDCPVLSHDGKKLYFNSSRPISEISGRRERIWCVERTESGWGSPVPLGPEINSGHLHWQTSVDKKENLFFGSERAGSKGKDDIFISEHADGIFKEPVSLGVEINSADHESTPYISPDGEYLIFSRDGLWISFRQKNGSWTKADYMGVSFRNRICPYVSPDKRYIFFLRMGPNNVYWASSNIIGELRNKALK